MVEKREKESWKRSRVKGDKTWNHVTCGLEQMMLPKLSHVATCVVTSSLRFTLYCSLLKVHNVCVQTEHPLSDKKCSESFRLKNRL